MARTNSLANFLTDVANAIRTKKGSETSVPASNFDTEILALPSQGTYEQRVLSISANGTQTITPSAGYDAIDELELTIAVPEKQLQSKTYNFTQNTNIELLPDQNYDGFDIVTLNINVDPNAVNYQIYTAAHIGQNNTIQRDMAQYSNYKQIEIDLLPYINRTIIITNTGDRNFYGFTSVKPEDDVALNNPRQSTSGGLTYKYTGGNDRYLVYDFTTSNQSDSVINVELASVELIEKNITANGVYDAEDDNADGFSKVTINVPGQQINNQDKTITQNGQYAADSGYTGLGTVTVNVPSGSGDVKLFETVEQMEQDTTAQEGDLAIVYREELTAVTEESEFDSCIFPNEVVLDEAFSDEIYGRFIAVDQSVMFDGMVDMSSSSFRFSGYGESDEIRVQYTSQDGITYTRTDGGEELQEFGVTIKYEPMSPWNDVIGNFMKIGGNYFEGLYQYSSTYLDTNYINTPISLEITDVSMGEYSSTSSYNVVYNTTLCSKIAISDILEKCNLVYNTLKGSSDSCMPIFYVDKNGNYVYMVQGGNGATPSNWYAGVQLTSVVADETNKITKINYVDYDCNIYYATVNPNTSEIQYTFVTTYERYYYTHPTGSSVRKDVRFVYTIPEPAMIPITLTLDYNTRLIKGVGDMVNIDYVETNNENFCTTPKSVSNKVSIYYLDPKYLLAKSQINATSDDVYEKTFYGKNGVENGILTTNVSNSFADVSSAVYAKIQAQYDNMQPRVLTDQDKEINTNIYFIPTNKNGEVLIDTSDVTNMNGMFRSCSNLTTIPLIDTSNVTNMNNMFADCTSLTTVPQLNTSSVTEMGSMFYDCTSLTTIPLIDTSNVTNMNNMFADCTSLTTVPQLNTSSVTEMGSMFYDCSALSNDSLNNILAMCTNATKVTSYKTLKSIGLTEEQANICKTLSNYQVFVNAGWTTGY